MVDFISTSFENRFFFTTIPTLEMSIFYVNVTVAEINLSFVECSIICDDNDKTMKVLSNVKRHPLLCFDCFFSVFINHTFFHSSFVNWGWMKWNNAITFCLTLVHARITEVFYKNVTTIDKWKQQVHIRVSITLIYPTLPGNFSSKTFKLTFINYSLFSEQTIESQTLESISIQVQKKFPRTENFNRKYLPTLQQVINLSWNLTKTLFIHNNFFFIYS